MERVEANIYVDDTMPEEARKAFIATVAEAEFHLADLRNRGFHPGYSGLLDTALF